VLPGDILGHGQIGEEIDFLMHRDDAGRPGRARVGEAPRLPANEDGAFVGLEQAGEDVQESRFAGAVLADEGVDAAGVQVEIDAGEGDDAGEAFGDTLELYDGGHLRCRSAFTGRGEMRIIYEESEYIGHRPDGAMMESLPLGHDPEQRQLNEIASLLNTPTFIRRARGVEADVAALVDSGQAQRDEWAAMARLRLGQLLALAGDPAALQPLLADEGQLEVLEELRRILLPKLRAPIEPTTSKRKLRRALVELVESLERFNERWRDYREKIDLGPLNRKRADYNRYYVLEKACALRSEPIARLGFTPLAPLTKTDVEALLPLLPMPRLAE
jgi:hypothetical protein